MTKLRLQWLTWLLLLLLLVIGALAYYWTSERARELAVQKTTSDILHRLKERDTALDKDVLRITSFQLKSYDRIVESVKTLRELQERLKSLQDDLHPRTAADLDRYIALSEKKIRQLQRIEATSASLKNTLRYLPTAVAEWRRSDAAGAEAQRINALLSDLLAYNLFPNRMQRQGLADRLDALRQHSASGDERLSNILFHAEANLRFRKELQQLLRDYRGIPTAEAITELQKAHAQSFKQRAERSNRLSMVLFALTALLLGLLTYTIRLLIKARGRAVAAWQQLHDAVESLSEGFALFDSRHRLVLWNRRYEKFHPHLAHLLTPGVSRDELARADAAHGVGPAPGSDGSDRAAGSSPAIGEDEEGRLEQLADGHWYLVSESVTSSGGLARVHVDITERRQMEEKVQRRNAELRRLAEVAAHHLQEPVRRSLVFAQRLQRHVPEGQADAHRLEEQLAAMSTLIGDLQAYLAYQTRTPEPEPVALGTALERARRQIDAGTDFRLTSEPDPLPAVPADPALLDTLLHQLLANAERYRRPDVPLEVHVEAHHRAGSWEITVTDNGQGMEAAYLERVFRLFERLYPDRDPEGTGLGLALARLIVDNHGGWIRAESPGPGQGTTIRFTLPDPPATDGSAATTEHHDTP